MQDDEIMVGLKARNNQRPIFEKELYLKYKYFIQEGCRIHNLSFDDSFSAYSDSLLSVIHNILNNTFNNQSSLKTYLFKIFSNKCIDQIRKKTTIKERVNISNTEPELLSHLPDAAKNVVEKLIDRQKIDALKQQIELIGEKCKKILLLFQDGYSDKELADELGYNNAAVAKVTRLRCLDKIKERMKMDIGH